MTYSKHVPNEFPSWLLSNKQSVTRLQAGHSSVVNLPNVFFTGSLLGMNKQAFKCKNLGLL